MLRSPISFSGTFEPSHELTGPQSAPVSLYLHHRYSFFTPVFPSIFRALLFSKMTAPAYSTTASTPMHVTPIHIE